MVGDRGERDGGMRNWGGGEGGVGREDHRGLETAGTREKEAERDGKRQGEGEVEDKKETM